MPTIIDNSGKKQSGEFIIGRVYKHDNTTEAGPPYICVNTAQDGVVPVMKMLISLKDGKRWSWGVPTSTAGWTEVNCVITISNKSE